MTEQVAGQVGWFDQDILYGKTFQERSQAIKAETSGRSSTRSSVSKNQTLPTCLCLQKGNGQSPDASMMTWGGGVLLGEFTMHSTGECPREERESRLSWILQDSAHPKYYLSAKACEGILSRAERRGKALPEILKKALTHQAGR